MLHMCFIYIYVCILRVLLYIIVYGTGSRLGTNNRLCRVKCHICVKYMYDVYIYVYIIHIYIYIYVYIIHVFEHW